MGSTPASSARFPLPLDSGSALAHNEQHPLIHLTSLRSDPFVSSALSAHSRCPLLLPTELFPTATELPQRCKILQVGQDGIGIRAHALGQLSLLVQAQPLEVGQQLAVKDALGDGTGHRIILHDAGSAESQLSASEKRKGKHEPMSARVQTTEVLDMPRHLSLQ